MPQGQRLLSEEEAPPGPEEKLIPKKETMKMLGVSPRTFQKIKNDLKEQFGMEPLLIWDDVNKRLASLYSLSDVRKMIELKALRHPGRRPKEDLDV